MRSVLTGAVGVLSLLLYAVGAVGLSLVVEGAIGAEDPMAIGAAGRLVLAVSAAALSGAVLLQLVREAAGPTLLGEPADRGAPVDAVLGSPPRSADGSRGVTLARWGAVIVAPIVVSWIEFELFVDPVDLFPLITVLGGIGFGLSLADLSPLRRARGVQRLLGVALVGLPLGLLAVTVPSGHYRAHGTGVTAWGIDSFGGIEPYRLGPASPPVAPRAAVIGGAELELIGAIAEAEPVPLVELLERGEVRLVEDRLFVRTATGGWAPAGGAGALDAALEAARAEDAEVERQRQAEHERSLARWRRSGRLFSRPEP